MDLPKNVTQIGETNHNCKIYVEDYVISYVKQLNGHAMDKGLAVGLYGVRKEEAGITYLFFYGAGKLNFLQREARHLSQAVLQEAEKLRKRYFGEYTFLGYCMLDGEMVEGFHVYEQGVCRYIAGYAQFYEKNDSMLRFMLEERREEAKPEEFNQEKYDAVKRRQEERRSIAEEHGKGLRSIYRERGEREKPGDMRLRRMKTAAAAVFVLLCVGGLASVSGGQGLGQLRTAIGEWVAGLTEKQLPDAVAVSNGTAQVGTIVAEDKLTEAIRRENQEAVENRDATEDRNDTESGEESEPSDSLQPSADSEPEPPESGEAGESAGESDASGNFEQTPSSAPESSEPSEAQSESQPESRLPQTEPAAEPVSYTVKRGDTLIGICLARYGSDARVAEICSLNNIENPDDIKVGEKILLPQ
ncbi:MAG: LysM peptidoglycan-binding domain-containing protein [bacterium]|nr:LysM peptidoglycan-binding domain-containing protein [bacterium]